MRYRSGAHSTGIVKEGKRCSDAEAALCGDGYAVIFIRMISDVEGKKVTLLKLEKAEMSHTTRPLCSIARYLAVD